MRWAKRDGRGDAWLIQRELDSIVEGTGVGDIPEWVEEGEGIKI